MLSRRRLLTTAGLALAGVGIGGCDTAAPSGGESPGKGMLKWWDHNPNLQPANKAMFARFAKEQGGVPVEYTYHPTSKLGQALQLAKQSNQLPDIHSNAGLNLPTPALIKAGWYQPIQLSDEARKRLPPDALVDGIHVFDGKVYSVPINSTRQYWAANWFNKDLVAKAGLDPANPPRTYDEFRAACRAVRQKGGGDAYGWIFNLGQPARVQEQINFLAQAAGFEGVDGVEFRTGEIAYHSEPYLAVMEFLLSLQKDKLLFPGSTALDDKVARVRWASGAAGFFFDGPWCAGDVSRDAKAFVDKLDVGPMLVPDAGKQVAAYRPPQGGTFWLSGSSKQPELASKLLDHLTEDQYYVDICRGMAPPPLDLSAIDRADVLPAWKKVISFFAEDAFVAPEPVVRNLDVSKVRGEAKKIDPDLGQIVQGAFSGDITNVATALKQLSDRNAADRERALTAAKQKGATVELSDWAFPNWQPRKDYTGEMYKA